MRSRFALAALLFAGASAAAADGGRLRASHDAGAFRISIFTSPEPLVAGPADVSALVLHRETGDALLDAEVTFELTGPGGESSTVAAGRHERNRLFYGAVVDLTPGAWTVTVRVRRAGSAAEARAAILVEDAAQPFGPWPYLALPPVAVALYAANRGLRRRHRRGP